MAEPLRTALAELHELRGEVVQISERLTRIEGCLLALIDTSTASSPLPNSAVAATPTADERGIAHVTAAAAAPSVAAGDLCGAGGKGVERAPFRATEMLGASGAVQHAPTTAETPESGGLVADGGPAAGGGGKASIAESRAAEEDALHVESQTSSTQVVDPAISLRAQVSFVDCFYDDLVNGRMVLLSQLNNLYKMRSGQNLDYKACGYERLRSFISDIPGLTLEGRGNYMQAQISDLTALQAFVKQLETVGQAQSEVNEALTTPHFEKPPSIPEHVLETILQLFLYYDDGISIKDFVQLWRSRNFGECFSYKKHGFRDLRGFLSQVPFIEKTGCRNEVKYVLKADYRRRYGASNHDQWSAQPQDFGSLGAHGFHHNDNSNDPMESGIMNIRTTGSFPDLSMTSRMQSPFCNRDMEHIGPPPSLQGMNGPPSLQGMNGQPSLQGMGPQLPLESHYSQDSMTQVVDTLDQKVGASYHFSSPGAFSSDTRDARKQQGKFDQFAVLHMHLLDNKPCLICDISNGILLLTNDLCEQLFDAIRGENRLVQENIFSLIGIVGGSSLQECFKYFLVSERDSLPPQRAIIKTLSGRSRAVHIEGCQLFGLWWRFEFEPSD